MMQCHIEPERLIITVFTASIALTAKRDIIQTSVYVIKVQFGATKLNVTEQHIHNITIMLNFTR